MHKKRLFVEKERFMFKVIKLRNILLVLTAILVTAAIVVGIVIGVRKEKAATAFSPLPKKKIRHLGYLFSNS